MTDEIMDKALSRAARDVRNLIEENGEKIKEAIRKQMLAKAEEGDGKLAFSLAIGSTITAEGNDANVSTSLAWAVKVKKVTESTVSNQEELPLESTVEINGKTVTFGRNAK
jgi:hypothetical protein